MEDIRRFSVFQERLIPVELFEKLEIQECIHEFSILKNIFMLLKVKAKSLKIKRMKSVTLYRTRFDSMRNEDLDNH